MRCCRILLPTAFSFLIFNNQCLVYFPPSDYTGVKTWYKNRTLILPLAEFDFIIVQAYVIPLET
jgi:hypothetical protein